MAAQLIEINGFAARLRFCMEMFGDDFFADAGLPGDQNQTLPMPRPDRRGR